MAAAGFFFGADNTTREVTFGSNFCTPPQNCVFQNRVRSNLATPPDDRTAAQLRGRINNRCLVDRHSPVAVVHIVWLPPLAGNRAVHFEISSARSDVEPRPVIHHNATDFAALADPITDNRNERDFSMRRDLPKDFAIPNRDVGKIVIAGDAISVRYIEDTVIAESHGRSQTGFAQRQRNVVPAMKMLVN